MRNLIRNFRIAWRRLAHSPAYAFFAAVSLFLGMTTSTGVFSLLYSMFWAPLPVAHPERVVVVASPGSSGNHPWRSILSLPDYQEISSRQNVFKSLAGVVIAYEPVGSDAADVQRVECVTDEYFETLGVRSVLGQLGGWSGVASRAQTVVVSFDYWTRTLASRGDVIGMPLRVRDEQFTVAGVAGRGFNGLASRGEMPTRAWLGLGACEGWSTQSKTAAPSTVRNITAVARLSDGRRLEEASAQLHAISFDIPGKTESAAKVPLLTAVAIGDAMREMQGSTARFAFLVAILTALALVVACTNLANLSLSRAVARQPEIAMRRVLGATPARLLAEHLAEPTVIALIGGGACFACLEAAAAFVGIDLPSAGNQIVHIAPVVDGNVLLAAGACLVTSLLIFGFLPGLKAIRADAHGGLAGQSVGTSARREGIREHLVRWQVVTSMVFFMLGVILLRATLSAARHDSGITLDRLVLATVDVDARHAPDLVKRIQDGDLSPGTAASVGLPFGVPAPLTMLAAATPSASIRPAHSTPLVRGTQGLLGVLGVPLLQGRDLISADSNEDDVVILSRRSAESVFGGLTGVLGAYVRLENVGSATAHLARVVGIAADTDAVHFLSSGEVIYAPLVVNDDSAARLVVLRRATNPAGDSARLRRQILGVAPTATVVAAGAASTILKGPYVLLSVLAYLASGLGAVTLLLAMVGLYGVLSHAVSRRAAEMGIRLALGATAGDLTNMVIREGLRPVCQGAIIGLLLGLAGGAALRLMLDLSASPVDVDTLLGVSLLLLIAGAVACYWPARRAASADPSAMLRQQ